MTTPAPHHSIFTGRMLFLTPNHVNGLKAEQGMYRTFAENVGNFCTIFETSERKDMQTSTTVGQRDLFRERRVI